MYEPTPSGYENRRLPANNMVPPPAHLASFWRVAESCYSMLTIELGMLLTPTYHFPGVAHRLPTK